MQKKRKNGASEFWKAMYLELMPRFSVQQQVHHAFQPLPDDIDQDVNEETALLNAVGEAEEGIEKGHLIANKEMKVRLDGNGDRFFI